MATPADLAVFGGGAGGGKTWALLLEAMRHKDKPGYAGVIFRRSFPQIEQPGGLWEQSVKLYPFADGVPKGSDFLWRFPRGAQIKFAHLQHEWTVQNWQGSEVPFIGFDELTHFSEETFYYMLSRNRSLSGVRPYVRATCNPDPDSFVARLISWWIGEDGYPIPARAGVLRWFVRENGALDFADSAAELVERHGPETLPKSLTFIPSLVTDNKLLLEANPEYLANLKALPLVEQARLLGGNWLVRAEAGTIFNRDWFGTATEGEVPKDGVECRFFDFAGSARKLAKRDPDYTATVKLRRYGHTVYVMHAHQERVPPAEHEAYMRQWVDADLRRRQGTPLRYMLRWEEEPGSASARETWRLVSLFAGLDAMGVRATDDKLTRAKPLAAQARVGNVAIVAGPWNEEWVSHMHNQPDWPHDDLMDASSGAFNALMLGEAGAGDALLQAFSSWG